MIDEHDFEIINNQELLAMVAEDNYDFFDRNISFEEVAPEYE